MRHPGWPHLENATQVAGDYYFDCAVYGDHQLSWIGPRDLPNACHFEGILEPSAGEKCLVSVNLVCAHLMDGQLDRWNKSGFIQIGGNSASVPVGPNAGVVLIGGSEKAPLRFVPLSQRAMRIAIFNPIFKNSVGCSNRFQNPRSSKSDRGAKFCFGAAGDGKPVSAKRPSRECIRVRSTNCLFQKSRQASSKDCEPLSGERQNRQVCVRPRRSRGRTEVFVGAHVLRLVF